MLLFQFSGTEGILAESETLTSGMVGKQVKLAFGPEWSGLFKTVVFSNGSIARSVVYTGEYVTIPWEILEKPLKKLTVGVYGVSAGGDVVIPTIRAEGPVIQPGVKIEEESSADPELPVWAQIQGLIGDIGALETEDTSCLVAAVNELAGRSTEAGSDGENGATFTPAVSKAGVLSWTNDKGLKNPASVSLTGPAGPQGEQGLTGAAGYTPVRGTDYWTEADKAEIKSYVDNAILGGAW